MHGDISRIEFECKRPIGLITALLVMLLIAIASTAQAKDDYTAKSAVNDSIVHSANSAETVKTKEQSVRFDSAKLRTEAARPQSWIKRIVMLGEMITAVVKALIHWTVITVINVWASKHVKWLLRAIRPHCISSFCRQLRAWLFKWKKREAVKDQDNRSPINPTSEQNNVPSKKDKPNTM